MSREHLSNESGAALVFALLAVIVLGGLATLFTARAISETRVTGSERDFEAAIHVAESGIDDVISVLNSDKFYVTTDDGTATGTPHLYDLALTASEDEQRAWAVAIAQDPSRCQVVDTGSGEACGIRPRDAGLDYDGDGEVNEPLPWIFGVSFVPSRSDPEKIRVIKVQFDKGFTAPDKAIKTNGSLTIGGDLTVAGANGAVHTNGDLTVVGSSVETTGPVTSTGSFSGDPSQFPSGSGQVGYEDRVQPVVALQVYQGTEEDHLAQDEAAKWTGSDPAGNYIATGTWFDLCSNGRIEAPNFDASGNPAPCTGARVVYDSAASGAPAEFRGWSFSSQGWSTGAGARVQDGVYYFHHTNARFSGNVGSSVDPVRISIIVDATGEIDPDAGTDTSCLQSGDESGNIFISGTGNSMGFEPFYGHLLFMADRDVKVQGNSSTTVGSSEQGGVIRAHEQIEITGTPTVYGGVEAEDACDTPSSPVHKNYVSGNFQLTYNGDGFLPLPSKTRITAWNEF